MNQCVAHSGPARQHREAASPHEGHGGRVFQTARALGCHPDEILDVSNNANSLAADLTAEVLAAIRPEHRYYPDPACTALREALARNEGLAEAQLLPVHGSAEGILLTLLALRPLRVRIVGPIFSEYPRLCDVLGIPWTLQGLRPEAGFLLTGADRAALVQSPEEAVILCSPNNPTGRTVPDLPGLLAGLAPRTVLVDLAYRDFLHGTPAWADHAPAALLQANPQAVCLTSMTKFFFCPGIRLGSVMAAAPLIRRVAALQPPWSVTQPAQEAGVGFVQRLQDYRARLSRLRELGAEYAAHLAGTPGVAGVLPSDANFLLVRLEPGLSASLAAQALAQRRILVRVCDDIPGMPAGHLRLQVRTHGENARVAVALGVCLQEMSS